MYKRQLIGSARQEFAADRNAIDLQQRVDRPREVQRVVMPVSYTHLRAHETVLDLVCRLLLEKKKNQRYLTSTRIKYRKQERTH